MKYLLSSVVSIDFQDIWSTQNLKKKKAFWCFCQLEQYAQWVVQEKHKVKRSFKKEVITDHNFRGWAGSSKEVNRCFCWVSKMGGEKWLEREIVHTEDHNDFCTAYWSKYKTSTHNHTSPLLGWRYEEVKMSPFSEISVFSYQGVVIGQEESVCDTEVY